TGLTAFVQGKGELVPRAPGAITGAPSHAREESALLTAKAVNVRALCPHTNLRAPPITFPCGPEAFWQDATESPHAILEARAYGFNGPWWWEAAGRRQPIYYPKVGYA